MSVAISRTHSDRDDASRSDGNASTETTRFSLPANRDTVVTRDPHLTRRGPLLAGATLVTAVAGPAHAVLLAVDRIGGEDRRDPVTT